MIRRIFCLGWNEIRLTWKDKTSAIWMVIMPMVFILFFGGVGSGGGGSSAPANRLLHLTVVDRDLTWLSRSVVESLKGEDFDVQEVAPEAIKKQENRRYTLVIPAGSAEAVAAGERVTLFLARTRSADRAAGMTLQVHLFRSLVKLLGAMVELKEVAPEGEPLDRQADRLQDVRRLQHRPSLVRLESSYAGQGHPVPSGFGQAIPGMLTQFMVMIVLIAGTIYLTTEKTTGVLKRLAVAPFTPRTLIAGKLAGLVFLALLQAGLLVAGGTLIGKLHILGAEFHWGSSPGGLALVVFSAAVATAGVTLFLGALLSSPTQASAVGWLAGMVMSGLGGCWWPMEIVPDWLQTVGHLFPTAWTMDALHQLISFGKGVEAVVPQCLLLLVYGVVFSLLGARFLKLEA